MRQENGLISADDPHKLAGYVLRMRHSVSSFTCINVNAQNPDRANPEDLGIIRRFSPIERPFFLPMIIVILVAYEVESLLQVSGATR